MTTQTNDMFTLACLLLTRGVIKATRINPMIPNFIQFADKEPTWNKIIYPDNPLPFVSLTKDLENQKLYNRIIREQALFSRSPLEIPFSTEVRAKIQAESQAEVKDKIHVKKSHKKLQNFKNTENSKNRELRNSDNRSLENSKKLKTSKKDDSFEKIKLKDDSVRKLAVSKKNVSIPVKPVLPVESLNQKYTFLKILNSKRKDAMTKRLPRNTDLPGNSSLYKSFRLVRCRLFSWRSVAC